jgi:hypothetical protein
MEVNLVAAVYTTVFCAVADWTCRVPGDAAAISPEAPGTAGAPPWAPWFGAWFGACVAAGAALLVPLPPHAASRVTSGIRASAAPAWMWCRWEARGREGVLTLKVMVVAPGLAGMGTELGMGASFAA